MNRRLLLLGIAFVIGLGVGGAVMGRYAWEWAYTQPLAFVPPSPLHIRAARPVYPFSVVPGGVYDRKELSDSMKLDRVVREHYQDIRPEALWTARINAPILAYVSYRKNGSVAWTKHKVTIPQGELVLTDGHNLIRARCGNRIRELPPPLSSTPPGNDDEPPVVIFESPTVPPLMPPTPFVPAGFPAFEPSLPSPGRDVPPDGSREVTPFPPVTPFFFPPSGPSFGPTPPPATPEPSTLVLAASGLALLWGLRRRRK